MRPVPIAAVHESCTRWKERSSHVTMSPDHDTFRLYFLERLEAALLVEAPVKLRLVDLDPTQHFEWYHCPALLHMLI